MFNHLKISSRILIVFTGLLILALSSGLIYLRSNAQLAPNAFQYHSGVQYESPERRFHFDELKDIKITRGFWNIDVIPSDSNFIKIKGALNILNYYLIADQTDTGIILSLSDLIKDDYLYEFNAEVYTNSLENIELISYANLFIDSAKYETLNVTLRNRTKLQLKDCEISELNFALYNKSTLETETCTIGNVSSSMYDSSFALIYSAESIVYNIQKGYSVLMTYDDKKNICSHISDTLLQISNDVPEFIQNLKWLSPYQKPFVFNGNELGDLESHTYSYSFWDEPKLSPKDVQVYSDYSYNSQSISFANESIIKGIKNGITLGYSKGLLTSIRFSFNDVDTSDSLVSLIIKRFKERFEFPEGAFSDSSYYKYEDDEHIYMTYVPDETTEFNFQLYFMRNRISGYSKIDITVSNYIGEDFENRYDKLRYYGSPFVSYSWY